MNKSIAQLVIMLCMIQPAWSQSNITLESGEKIPYYKFKSDSKFFRITQLVNDKKVKKNILIDSIQSYEDGAEVYYKKKNPVKGSSRKFLFLSKEVVGKITLYTKTESYFVSTGKYGGYMSVDDYLYFEKDSNADLIVLTNALIKNKKKYLETLIPFVQDDPEILAKVENDFKFTSENVIQIIKEYNQNSATGKN